MAFSYRQSYIGEPALFEVILDQSEVLTIGDAVICKNGNLEVTTASAAIFGIVVDLVDGACLAKEPLDRDGVDRKLAPHQLDRDLTPEAGVLSPIDKAHAAFAQQLQQSVGSEHLAHFRVTFPVPLVIGADIDVR